MPEMSRFNLYSSHGCLLYQALSSQLKTGVEGFVVFTDCLTKELVHELKLKDHNFIHLCTSYRFIFVSLRLSCLEFPARLIGEQEALSIDMVVSCLLYFMCNLFIKICPHKITLIHCVCDVYEP